MLTIHLNRTTAVSTINEVTIQQVMHILWKGGSVVCALLPSEETPTMSTRVIPLLMCEFADVFLKTYPMVFHQSDMLIMLYSFTLDLIHHLV